METKNNYIWHLTAVVVVGIWGLTFISTRVLIESGLTPQEIFLLRFLIAYIGIWFISPRKLLCNTWRDEGWMLLAGVTGGSLYFLTENTALEVTLTTNVAFIVCSTPLLTLLLYRLFFRSEKATWKLTAGSLLALMGVGLVIFNGNFVLKLSPLGDLLSLSAALCWAFYSLIMKLFFGLHYPQGFLLRPAHHTSCVSSAALAVSAVLVCPACCLDESAVSQCAGFPGLLCGVEYYPETFGHGTCLQLHLPQSHLHLYGRSVLFGRTSHSFCPDGCHVCLAGGLSGGQEVMPVVVVPVFQSSFCQRRAVPSSDYIMTPASFVYADIAFQPCLHGSRAVQAPSDSNACEKQSDCLQ